MTRVRILRATLIVAACIATVTTASGSPDADGLTRFRGLFKELIETNTTLSAGDCTLAAQRMATRLRAAGYPDEDVRVFVPEGHPKEGGLVAVLHGSNRATKAILMLAHLDVVEAHREDWSRDPFTLVEEDGYFYARGTADMKAQAAIWVDNLLRYRETGYKPKRTIKLALTCGEESDAALNGVDWLIRNARDAIDAELALTEGVDGALDERGHRVALQVLAAEKASQNYRFEVTNPGGHSSRPVPDNAIYRLARALDRLSQYEFPVQLIDANREFFAGTAPLVGGENEAAMRALVNDPRDKAAVATLDRDPYWHAMLRTTCVATMLSAGHATNALPQRARATVNCRLIPGNSVEEVLEQLVRIANDPAVVVSVDGEHGPVARPVPLTRQVLAPIEQEAHRVWPGVPVIPTLEPAASDARFLNPAGIPTYGVSGLFMDPDGGRMHGLNERVRIQSVYEGRAFLYGLVKRYADQ